MLLTVIKTPKIRKQRNIKVQATRAAFVAAQPTGTVDLRLENLEHAAITEALERTGYKLLPASRLLGIHRHRLSRRMERLNISGQRVTGPKKVRTLACPTCGAATSAAEPVDPWDRTAGSGS